MSTCYSETSSSMFELREVIQDNEDLGQKFGQRTKFSFLGPGHLDFIHLKGRDLVGDLRSKRSGEQS